MNEKNIRWEVSRDLWKVESSSHCVTGLKEQRQLQGRRWGHESTANQPLQGARKALGHMVQWEARMGWGLGERLCTDTRGFLFNICSSPSTLYASFSFLEERGVLLCVWPCGHVIQRRTWVKNPGNRKLTQESRGGGLREKGSRMQQRAGDSLKPVL